MTDADTVLHEVTDTGVAVLTLNRPERLNTWTLAMEDRYFDRLLEAEADERVRAIVVTGAGRGFSPGVDLQSGDDPKLYASLDRRPTTLPLTIRKPIITAINGSVAGVSLVQALQCDLRFVAEGVKLTFAFPGGDSSPSTACRGCCPASSARPGPSTCCSRVGWSWPKRRSPSAW